MTNTNTDINPSNEAVNDIAKKAIEPHNFWCICLSFLNDPNYLVCPASFLHELYPLNCDDIELPITLTNLQLFLLALNTNPSAYIALQHFTLEEKYIRHFCSPGAPFPDTKMFGRDLYVNIKALKESFALQPFQGGVNVLQILSKNPRVNALFDIIMAEFPEGDSKPNEGLRLLLKLALKNENSESSDKPSNKPHILISSENIRRLLNQVNKSQNTEQKLQLYADKIYRYLKEFEPQLLEKCSVPVIANVINENLKLNLTVDTIQTYLSKLKIFQSGEKFTQNKDQNTREKLSKIIHSLDFNIFH